jgi:predicted nucleotidyltransferase component of viral defense system
MTHDEEMMVARDVIQGRILGEIFSNKIKDGLALKGGMAMRVMTMSQRYTKDIDLAADPRLLTPKQVSSWIFSSLRGLQKQGFAITVPDRPQKETETTIRVKVAGKIGDADYNLTIEVSRRQELKPERIKRAAQIGPDGFKFVVDCVDLNELVMSKIDCLASPMREAPRDIYDLAVLISMEVKPPMHLMAQIPVSRLIEMKETLWAKIEKMNYASASENLLRYLPNKARSEMTEEAWSNMQIRVGCSVEEWIDACIAYQGNGTNEATRQTEDVATEDRRTVRAP